jgi:hypothetical protein
MKTGRDADTSGLYVSECCLTEFTLVSGQMFPRCLTCFALTVWEFVPQSQSAEGSSEPSSREISNAIDSIPKKHSRRSVLPDGRLVVRPSRSHNPAVTVE